MFNLSRRLAAIEKRLGAQPGTDHTADAKTFADAILRLADRFHEADAAMDEAERIIRMSPAQRLAWALRFGTDAQLEQAMADSMEMVA